MKCLSHNLNFIIQDIMKLSWANSIFKQTKAIVKFFKNHNILTAIFKHHQQSQKSKVSLKLPAKTRWVFFLSVWNQLKLTILQLVLLLLN